MTLDDKLTKIKEMQDGILESLETTSPQVDHSLIRERQRVYREGFVAGWKECIAHYAKDERKTGAMVDDPRGGADGPLTRAEKELK